MLTNHANAYAHLYFVGASCICLSGSSLKLQRNRHVSTTSTCVGTTYELHLQESDRGCTSFVACVSDDDVAQVSLFHLGSLQGSEPTHHRCPT